MNPSLPFHELAFHELVAYVDALPADAQERLFELIQKRQIEKRRLEIAQNAAETLEAVRTGAAKRRSVADLLADVLNSNE